MANAKSTTPALRFKGFDVEWEEQKASNIFLTVADKGHPKLPVLSATQDRGMIKRIHTGININHDERNEITYKRVMPGQFVIHLRSFQGGLAHSTTEGITSPAYTVMDFIHKEHQYDQYWKHIFNSEKFIKSLEAVTYGIRDGRSISFDDLSTLSFTYPDAIEQKKIGNYFQNLDSLIALQRRKLVKLQNVKKAMLRKMLPTRGSTIPQIRFAGFTEPWELHSLSNVVAVGSGKDYKHLDEGKIPVYGTGGYMLSVNEALSYNADAVGIGRKGTIDKPYLLEAPFWTVDTLFYCIPRRGFDLHFSLQLFRNIDWRQKDESTGVPSLSKETINTVEVLTPHLNEQKRIGDFFKHLDTRISLQQRKLEKLQNVKKACLAAMFV